MSGGARVARTLGIHDAGRALRDFATYLPTQLVPALAGFLVIPVIARKLSPTDLGVLTICQTLVTLGWTIVASWLAAAILRELPAHRVANELGEFSEGLKRAVLSAGGVYIAFGVAVIGLGEISSAAHDNALLVIAATGGLSIQNIAVSIFAASLRPRAYAIVDVGARLGGAILGVSLVFDGHGIQGYLAGLAAASIFTGAIGLLIAWPRGRSHGRVSIRPWLHYGVPASAAAVATWLLAFVDRYILAILRDTGSVGVYSVSSAIGDRAVAIPVMAFFTATGPLIVTAFERHGRVEVERLMTSYTRIALLIGVPIVAFIYVSASDLVWILTGKYDYAKHANIAWIIAVGSLLMALASISATGLVIAKNTRPMIRASVIAVVVNIGLNFALIPPFGLIGAAIATPVAIAVYVAFTYRAGRAHARWAFPLATLVRTLTAATLGGIAATAATPAGGWRPLALLISATVGVLVYIVVLLALGERRSLALSRAPDESEYA